MASKFHCPEHYDKPQKARKMEAVASTFLKVLSSLGRGIFDAIPTFFIPIRFAISLFKSMPPDDDVAAGFC